MSAAPLIHPKLTIVRSVLEVAAAAQGITVSTLLSGSQEANIVAAKRSVARTLRQPPYSYSLNQIGRALGGMHHTSVKHLIDTEAPRLRAVAPRCLGLAAGDDLRRRVEEIEVQEAALRTKLAELDALRQRIVCAMKVLANDEEG